MRGIVHPFSKALYEVDQDGNIRITDGDRVGTFDRAGRWISGELRECDPQLCGWVGGPQVANHRLDASSSSTSGTSTADAGSSP